ncbi:MAG TPA: pyridoxamine 5'-phosphate oxidase family protein [Methylomirabilota bacterium]|nr:pyridoxamine 5'-phosphate oxidase family protein [Methylomirabilota bacterium]
MSPSSEPSFAARARALVHRVRTGTLSTQSQQRPGYPFGSLAPYAPDERGRPVFLFSALSLHTKNLAADRRASLLVTPVEPAEDPLALARVTLLGEARRLTAAEAAADRARYLARHPGAAMWVDFADFAFWRLDVMSAYFVGGFGAMDWIAPDTYAEAHP